MVVYGMDKKIRVQASSPQSKSDTIWDVDHVTMVLQIDVRTFGQLYLS